MSKSSSKRSNDPMFNRKSYFRQPYLIFIWIVILVAILTTTTWFLAINVSFNANEKDRLEEIAYHDKLQQNIEIVNNVHNKTLNLMNEVRKVTNAWLPPFSEKYYLGKYAGGKAICFTSKDDMCFSVFESSEHLDFAYSYHSGTYSIEEIRTIYFRLIKAACTSDEEFERYGWMRSIEYLKNSNNSKIDVFQIGWYPLHYQITYVGTDGKPIECGETHGKFYMREYTYDLLSVAQNMTLRSDLAKPVIPLLIILILSWTAILMVAYYGIIGRLYV